MSLVHDNIIVSYHVAFARAELVLSTEYYDGGICTEQTDIVFRGYLAHTFEQVRPGSVLFDVEECAVEHFIRRWGDFLEEKRRWNWPLVYRTQDTLEEFSAYLRDNGYSIYEVSATWGLSGFVFARELRFVVNSGEHLPGD